MRKILILAGLIGSNVYAEGNWRLISPNDIHVDVYKSETVHDPYLDPIDSQLRYGAGFNLDLDIAKYNGLGLYWNNLLHFDQSSQSGQIKHGGWQYEIGAVIWQENGFDRVQLFKQHHSRHIFEETRDVHFPVYDRYGFRLRVYP